MKFIRKFKEKLNFNESTKNVLTLISGTSLAQLINIGSIPILSRIYSPSDFGVLGIYLAITSIGVSFSSLQYSRAIIIPEENEKASALLQISTLSILSISLVLFVLAVVYNIVVPIFFGFVEPLGWLYFIPLSVLFLGCRDTFYVWSNRLKEYNRIAKSRVIAASITAVCSIGLGLIFNYELGLIIGLIGGHLIFFLYLGYQVYRKDKVKMVNNFRDLISVAREFVNFPKFTLPSDILNVFINQVPILALGLCSTQSNVGFFNMSNKALGLPISLVGGALSEVFKQKASETYNKHGECHALYVSTLKKMVLISVMPMLVLLIFAPKIFTVILGDEWKEVGYFAQVLTPMYLFRFFAGPLSFLYHLSSNQKEELKISLLLVFILMSVFGLFTNYNIYLTMTLYSFIFVLAYSFVLWRGYVFSKGLE